MGVHVFDLRGRVSSQSWPATATAPARTVGYTYGVGGNPLVSSVADPAGTVRSIVDLLGRVTTYTDVWDKTTTVAYDQAGRATTTTGPQGVITQAYDANTSKPTTLTRNSTVLASAGYSGDGWLRSPTPTAPACPSAMTSSAVRTACRSAAPPAALLATR